MLALIPPSPHAAVTIWCLQATPPILPSRHLSTKETTVTKPRRGRRHSTMTVAFLESSVDCSLDTCGIASCRIAVSLTGVCLDHPSLPVIFHVRFLFVEDNRYVAVHNLHTFLAHKDPSQPHYIGLMHVMLQTLFSSMLVRSRIRRYYKNSIFLCSLGSGSCAQSCNSRSHCLFFHCLTRLSFVLTGVQSDATPSVATIANRVGGQGQDFVIAYVLHQLGITLEDAKDSQGLFDVGTWPIRAHAAQGETTSCCSLWITRAHLNGGTIGTSHSVHR